MREGSLYLNRGPLRTTWAAPHRRFAALGTASVCAWLGSFRALAGVIAFGCSLPLGCCAHRAAADETPSPLGLAALAVAADGQTAFVAAGEAQQLLWVALPEGRVTKRLDLPGPPTGLVLTPDGGRLIVTCAAPTSTVVVVESASGKVVQTIPAGHTAMGPAVAADGLRVYVCNRFSNDVSVIDLACGVECARVPAEREPVAAAVAGRDGPVLVANHLPHARTDLEYAGPVAPVVTAIDPETLATTPIKLPDGATAVQDLAISPDGERAYVPHVLANFQRPPSQVEMGWTNMNVVTVLDVDRRTVVGTFGLDDLFQGAGNPWGVACTADGQWIGVTHAGTSELSLLEASQLGRVESRPYLSSLVGEVPRSSSGPSPRRRLTLPGDGLREIAIQGSRVYAAGYFSDTLVEIELAAEGEPRAREIALGPRGEPTLRRRGESLFHNARLCYQHWQSCASCHPDGRADGLTWDLLNDGLGTFKNTKSMLLAHATPPSMSQGVRATAEVAVRAGLRHILFADYAEDDAVAIDVYLRSLEPVSSPRLVDGQLHAAALRGKELFFSDRVRCVDCHPPPLYTDLRMHDVGTRTRFEYVDRFDTPTLVETWRTAPYLHDGRYTTLGQLFQEGRHGLPRRPEDALTEVEIGDLVEFVSSL